MRDTVDDVLFALFCFYLLKLFTIQIFCRLWIILVRQQQWTASCPLLHTRWRKVLASCNLCSLLKTLEPKYFVNEMNLVIGDLPWKQSLQNLNLPSNHLMDLMVRRQWSTFYTYSDFFLLVIFLAAFLALQQDYSKILLVGSRFEDFTRDSGKICAVQF